MQELVDRLIPPDGEMFVSTSLFLQLGVKRCTVYAWIQSGRLPPPIKLSQRRHVYERAVARAAMLRILTQGGAA